MPYTPLVTAPDGDSDAIPDPFEALLSRGGMSSQSKPLFSESTSKKRPDELSRITSTSKSMSPSGEPTSSTSVRDDFGAFVSVSPSADPLGGSYDSYGFSSPSEASVNPFVRNPAFVTEARQRAEETGRRVLGELTSVDEDLLFSVHSSNGDSQSGSNHAVGTTSNDKANTLANETSSDIEAVSSTRNQPDSQLSYQLDSALPSTTLRTARSSSPEVIEDEKMSASMPDLRRGASSSDFAMHTGAHVEPRTSFISSTLPRKWSSFFSSGSPQSSPSSMSSAPPSNSPSMSPGPSVQSVTHRTPFSQNSFVPPSGAPGFTGDRNWNSGGFEYVEEQKAPRLVALVGRVDSARPVLSQEIIDAIRKHLPPLFRLTRQWNLLYSLDQHGISLGTFYSRVTPYSGTSGCLLAIKDADDGRFGVWIGDGIRKSSGQSYYGSGESFLWKMPPDGGPFEVFKWTGKNDYVALCQSESISFGGGDGRYGLFLDSTLYDGSTSACPTFDNQPLCGEVGSAGTVRFECVGLEAWSISR